MDGEKIILSLDIGAPKLFLDFVSKANVPKLLNYVASSSGTDTCRIFLERL